MKQKISLHLGNRATMFLWSFAMLLTGVVIGAHWHPSRAIVVAIGIIAGVFMMLHELACCVVCCSITAWWIGRRTSELKGGGEK